MRLLNYKPLVSPKTGQIKINLRKKTLPKKLLKDLPKLRNIKLRIEGWDCDGD